MDMRFVKDRLNYFLYSIQENSVFLNSFLKKFENRKNIENINGIVENYNSLHTANKFGFVMNKIEDYISNSKSNNVVQQSNLLVSRLMNSEKDLYKYKNIVFDFAKKYNADNIIKEYNDIIMADRILENEKRINNRINLSKMIITDGRPDYNKATIEGMCIAIDSFNCDKNIKYNLALENISYEVYKRGLTISDDDLFNTITNYFKLVGADVKKVIKCTPISDKFKMSTIDNATNTPFENKYNEIYSMNLEDSLNNFSELIKLSNDKNNIVNNFKQLLQFINDRVRFVNDHQFNILINNISSFTCDNISIENINKLIKLIDEEIIYCNNYKYTTKSEIRSNKIKSILDLIKNKLTIQKTEKIKEKERNENMMNKKTVYKEEFEDKYINRFIREYKDVSAKLQDLNKHCIPLKGLIDTVDESRYVLNNRAIQSVLTESKSPYLKVGTMKTDYDTAYSYIDRISSSCKESCICLEDRIDGYIDIFVESNYSILNINPATHKNLLESAIILEDIVENMSYIADNKDNILSLIESNVGWNHLNYIDISNLSEVFAMYGEKSDIDNQKEYLNNKYLRETNLKSKVNIQESYNLLNSKYDLNSFDRLFTFANNLKCMSESFGNIDDIEQFDIMLLNEGFNDALFTLKEKIRKTVVKLSDKEKMLSRQIDSAIDRMLQGAEEAKIAKNREAVIKGRILPPASTIIKLAITSGIGAFIDPAIGVITFLGGLAVNQLGRKSEKDAILDEIDVELKIVEKEIALADRKDDTDALRKLYRLEKKLKRESARIKYNKADFIPKHE